MKEFTRSQIAEHLKWVYSRPGYYKENKKVRGLRPMTTEASRQQKLSVRTYKGCK